MILYNITFSIENSIRDQWLSWIRQNYLPFVLNTHLFVEVKVYRLLNETENDGFTYSVQFFSDSLGKVNAYLENYASEITEKHNSTFRHQHVSFMTILEPVDFKTVME